MDIYLYTARDLLTQKKVKGEMKGESEEDIYDHLVDKNLYPQVIKKKTILNTEIRLLKSKIKLNDINFFCKQLATMVQAGVSVTEALKMCASQSSNKVLNSHIAKVYEKVKAGKALSQAVEEEIIFPPILVHLIACGERSGNLDEVMRQAVVYFENQLGIRKKVKKALTYPLIVLCLVAIVLVILMIKVVPTYMSLLDDTGAQIPLPTQIVVGISNFLIAKWQMLLIAIISSVIGVRYLKKISHIKKTIEEWYLRCPLLGKLIKQNLTATFATTMAMLIQSGIPVVQAMDITKKVMNHTKAEEEMEDAIMRLKQGETLVRALSQSEIFPLLLFNMISVGEASGSLGEVLMKMGVYFRGEVERIVDQLITLIEPAMMIIVALAVGGVMAAIILPTFSAATAAI